MFTAIYLFMVAPLLVILFALLTAVRVGRANFLEGLVVFFLFWPIGAILALVAHWRDPEVRVRVPALFGLLIGTAWIGALVFGTHAANEAAASAAARHGAESTQARELRLSSALSNLPKRNGTVLLPGARARIEVPEHFRFVERSTLTALFRQFDDELDKSTVGWLVHESVDLAADDAWFVVVDWYREGFVAEGDFTAQPADKLLADAQHALLAVAAKQNADPDFRLLRYAERPELDPNRHLATWVEETASDDDPQPVVDCYAAKLGRRGALQFSLTDMAPHRQELCLRSVRLAAARTNFIDGEGYDDHSRLFDHNARYDLAGFVTGTALLKP